MRIKWLVLLATASTIGISPAYALQPVPGKICKPGDFIHGIWQSVVSSRSCADPVYLSSGMLQGAIYPEGCYCFRVISKLQILHYDPEKHRSGNQK